MATRVTSLSDQWRIAVTAFTEGRPDCAISIETGNASAAISFIDMKGHSGRVTPAQSSQTVPDGAVRLYNLLRVTGAHELRLRGFGLRPRGLRSGRLGRLQTLRHGPQIVLGLGIRRHI